MIKNSFLFLPGISQKTEQKLWQLGIKEWDDVLQAKNIPGIKERRKGFYDRKLMEAKKELYAGNATYFANLLPLAEHWRLYDFFKEEVVYLDIETSGMERDSYVTVIGLFDGINTKTLVKDINLDFKVLKRELERYKIIITFNGNVFDLPYLEKYAPGLLPNIPKIDLRHLCNRVGFKGGLKDIEKQLNIQRTNPIIEKLYGGDAIKLWRRYKATGDDYFLKLLVEYNEEDVINLKAIMEKVYILLSPPKKNHKL